MGCIACDDLKPIVRIKMSYPTINMVPFKLVLPTMLVVEISTKFNKQPKRSQAVARMTFKVYR